MEKFFIKSHTKRIICLLEDCLLCLVQCTDHSFSISIKTKYNQILLTVISPQHYFGKTVRIYKIAMNCFSIFSFVTDIK